MTNAYKIILFYINYFVIFNKHFQLLYAYYPNTYILTSLLYYLIHSYIYIYLKIELKIKRNHVLSAWSGIRPLAIDPHQVMDAKNTKTVSRDHIVSYNDKTGVVFVSGMFVSYFLLLLCLYWLCM